MYRELYLFTDDDCSGKQPLDELSSVDPFDKMNKAIRLIRSVARLHNFTCGFSGGKDSVLLKFLIERAGVKCQYVHNDTTIDPPGTLEFVRRQSVTIVRPDVTFFSLMRKKGVPTMWRRFCCSELKERYIGDYVFFGIRREESAKRRARYTDFEACRIYRGGLRAQQIFPLLDFTSHDVEVLTNEFSLENHRLYFTADGRFDVTRRLGCVGCPLQSDRGKADFFKYPGFLRLWIKNCIYYHQRLGRSEYDAYLQLVHHLFYSNHGFARFNQTYHGFFSRDPKEFLLSYFKISL